MGMVTLIDGREVDSYSEEWRQECEARHVLSLRTLGKRQEYLATVDKRRGRAAGAKLRRIILAIHQRRQVAANDSAAHTAVNG